MTLRERLEALRHAREVASINREARREAREVSKGAHKVQVERIRASERQTAAVRLRALQKSRQKIAEEREVLALIGRRVKGKKKKSRIQQLSKALKKIQKEIEHTGNYPTLKELEKM